MGFDSLLGLPSELGALFVDLGQLHLARRLPLPTGVYLGLKLLAPAAGSGDLLAELPNLLAQHALALLTGGYLRCQGGHLTLGLGGGAFKVARLEFRAAAGALQTLKTVSDRRQQVAVLVEPVLDPDPLLQERMILGKEMQALELLQLFAVELVTPGPAGLVFDRAESFFNLAQDIVQAKQVLLDSFEPSQSFFLAGLVLAYARRLVKDRSPVVRRGLQERLDVPLLDNSICVVPHTGIHEHLADILEPARGLIDKVLALPAAKQPAANGDNFCAILVGAAIWPQYAGGITEDQRHFHHAGRTPGGRAVEDDVHHLVATKAPGRLFTKNPLDGIHDVALAAAVGAHNTTYAVVEVKLRAIGKALEPRQDELIKLHGRSRL